MVDLWSFCIKPSLKSTRANCDNDDVQSLSYAGSFVGYLIWMTFDIKVDG